MLKLRKLKCWPNYLGAILETLLKYRKGLNGCKGNSFVSKFTLIDQSLILHIVNYALTTFKFIKRISGRK